MQDPNLFSVPVWKGHEKSLGIQTRKVKATESSSEASKRYLSRPNGEPCARVDRPDRRELDAAIKAIQDAKLHITFEGDLTDFLGVKIERKSTNEIIFTQPHLIDNILNDLGLKHEKDGKETPAASSRILTRNNDGVDHNKSFHYRSVIGKLNYLEKATRPDISFATHQCAHFAAAPKKSHTRVVRWLGRYLLHSKKKGMRFQADTTCGLEVFVDASFAGNWDKKDAQTGDHDTARSRHGYIILYYGCPLIWKSQLQTEIALSSTESEYTRLSYALHEAIPLMSLLDELKERGFPVDQTKATVQCKVAEDNSGAVEIATNHKWHPRTTPQLSSQPLLVLHPTSHFRPTYPYRQATH